MDLTIRLVTIALLLLFLNQVTISQTRSVDRSTAGGFSLSVPEMTESAYRAANILARAVRSIGGEERLDSLRSIGLSFEADVAATFQGPDPDKPHRMLPRTGDLLFDLGSAELLTFSETRWPNFAMRSRSLFREGKTYTLDEQTKTYRTAADTEVFDSWSLRLMPWVLQRLKSNPTGAIDGGVKQVNGKQYDVVLASLGTQRIHRVYFLQATGLPEIIEHLDYSSDFGDLTVRRVFADYVTIGDVLIPTTVKMYNNDQEVFAYRLKNVVLNPAKRSAELKLPDGYTEAVRGPGGPVMQTRTLGEGVHLIENLAGRDYNVMFADLGDSVIVFEAPIDLWASKMVLSEIRKVYPSKPIKYVMVTHFHDDHAAGIRTYISEGVTVITTPGNQKYFEHVARIRHELHRENRLLKSAAPKFELVRNGSHEIKGSKLTVRFIDLGPTPHVDENIVAYIPEMGILFQGDYFRVPADRGRPEPIRPEGTIFLRRLKEKGLAVKQLVGVHGPIGTVQDLERAAETAAPPDR